jgi:hypothetical protein
MSGFKRPFVLVVAVSCFFLALLSWTVPLSTLDVARGHRDAGRLAGRGCRNLGEHALSTVMPFILSPEERTTLAQRA